MGKLFFRIRACFQSFPPRYGVFLAFKKMPKPSNERPKGKESFSSPENSAYHAGTLRKGEQQQVCLRSGLEGGSVLKNKEKLRNNKQPGKSMMRNRRIFAKGSKTQLFLRVLPCHFESFRGKAFLPNSCLFSKLSPTVWSFFSLETEAQTFE